MRAVNLFAVIPAKAGIQVLLRKWIPDQVGNDDKRDIDYKINVEVIRETD